MRVGRKIKQLRELRNFTQSYMADQLGISINGYGKIERDETEITVKRVEQIAEVLDTNLNTILSFDSNQVFNLYNNKTATSNGIVQNQQIIADQSLDDFFVALKSDIDILKKEFEIMKKK